MQTVRNGSVRTAKRFKPSRSALTRLKEPLTDIKMLAPRHNERPSACTLTMSDVEKNALDYQGSVISAKDSIRAIDRDSKKIKVWPEIHDHKSPTVSAGKAIGVFCQYPPPEEPEHHIRLREGNSMWLLKKIPSMSFWPWEQLRLLLLAASWSSSLLVCLAGATVLIARNFAKQGDRLNSHTNEIRNIHRVSKIEPFDPNWDR